MQPDFEYVNKSLKVFIYKLLSCIIDLKRPGTMLCMGLNKEYSKTQECTAMYFRNNSVKKSNAILFTIYSSLV